MLQLMFQLKLSKIEFKKSKQDDAVQIGRMPVSFTYAVLRCALL